MNDRNRVTCAYAVLFLLSWPVPLLHYFLTDRVISTMRPMIKVNNSWVPTLMPPEIQLLRALGGASWWLPFIDLALLLFSFRHDRLTKAPTICALSIGQCAFTTLYAFYSTLILGAQWLEWTQRPHG